MEKILLVIPPSIPYERFVNPGLNERVAVKKSKRYGVPITDMPIGVISLSAYLKKHVDVEVKLIDFNIVLNKLEGFKYDSFASLYRDYLLTNISGSFNPDIVGLSVLFTTAYFNMIDIADVAKDMFPEALIIAGGGVPTNLYKRIFEDTSSFDALCFGEGEKPLLDLLKAKDRRGLLRNHKSWITKEKASRHDSYEYDFIYELDEIPFYDYSILDLDSYGLIPTLTNYSSFKSEGHLIHYMTSRGCPYRCCFCASHTVHGRQMRYHSINRVKEDFIRLKNQFQAKIINFQDDNLLINKKRAHQIISIANEINLQLYFQNGITIYSLDREMLQAMKKAGVDTIVLPIESGSSRVLHDIMHKPLNLSIVKKVADDCRQLGIHTEANILIGLPGETKQDIEDARIFLKSLNVNWFRIVVATPLVGSEMYKICLEKNYLKGDGIGCDYKNAVINTKEFTAEYIKQKAYLLNIEINFVENSDFRLGNYKKALAGFENVIKVRGDHAFAYYFASQCCKIMGLNDKYQSYKEKYQELVKGSVFWQNCATRFNIPTT